MGPDPWGCKELDMTEQLTHTHTHTHTMNRTEICSRFPGGSKNRWHEEFCLEESQMKECITELANI